MKRNFVQLKEYIEQEFPEMKGRVFGENYPVPSIIELVQQLLQLLQLFVMALMIFGDGLWTNVLRLSRVPEWYYPLKSYGFQFCIVVFFLLPQGLNRYIITGAFEMFVDGRLVYSKLDTGRMPHVGDIRLPLINAGLVPTSVPSIS